MGEINKIGSNPFDVKIQQLSPERRFHKEPTITDEENRKGGQEQQQTGAQSSQSQAQENPGMTGLLETLRKRQAEQNYNEYVERKAALQRERNRQASEEYIRNVEEYREEQAEKADAQLEETIEHNKIYTSRLQDISQKHVEKLLRHKGDSDLSERARQLKEAGQREREKKESSLSSARAKLRPEVSRLLNQKPAAQTAEPPPPGQENRQLLDSAVNKLRMKLGGAHLNPNKGIQGELNPILQPGQTYQGPARPEGKIFRPDLEQVKHSIEHARALKNEDPNRYIPLEEADIQQMLFEHKLPISPGMVQSLLLASQRLRDSSHIFMKAALLVATAELHAETEMMRVICEALRTFEKYPRPSIVSKLLRYLLGRKVAQIQALDQNIQRPAAEPPVEADDLILLQTHAVPNFKGGKGRLATGLPAQPAPLPTDPDRSQAPLYQAVRRSELKILTPEEIAQAYEEAADLHPMHEQVETWLKRFGLPASKVMVNQLVQSAKGDAVQAQALVLQLALGKSLTAESLQTLAGQLRQLSPAARELPAEELLRELGLESSPKLSERLETQPLREARLSKSQIKQWQQLLSGPLQTFRPALDQASQRAREGLLLLHELAQRTETLNSLMPRLQQALRIHPRDALQQLEGLLPTLQPLMNSPSLPRDRSLKAESKLQLSQAYGKALQPGASANLLPELVSRLQWQRPLTLSTEVMKPEDWQLPAEPAPAQTPVAPATPAPAPDCDPLQPLLSNCPESTRQLLERMSLARQALQLMLELAEKTGIRPQLLSRLSQRLSQQEVLPALQRLEHLTPLLKQGIAGLTPPSGQLLSPESQQQLLHVLQQQLDKGGQAYLLPRVMADLRWIPTETARREAVPALPQELRPTAQAPQNAPSESTPPPLRPGPAPLSSPPPPTGEAADLEAWTGQLMQNYSQLPATAYNLTRESILLIATLAERTGTLQTLLPRLSALVTSQPQLTAQNLQSIQPALKQVLGRYLAAGASPLPADRQSALSELILQRLQQPHTQPVAAEGLEAIWQRFYSGEMPAALSKALSLPEARQGFTALHQLIQDFELSAYWQQSIRSLWQSPPAGLEQRLSQLSLLLQPALQYLEQYPQQHWLLSSLLQNRITQALQQYLSTGQAEALQSSLVRLMTENPHQRNPLPLVEERLRSWGIQTHPALNQQLWSLAQGSRDRLDALALLHLHHLPLLSANTSAVLRYLKGIPPQNRFQSASQILRFLSPELIGLINQSLQRSSAAPPEQLTSRPAFLARWLAAPVPGSAGKLLETPASLGADPEALFHSLETVLGQLKAFPASPPLSRLGQNLSQLLSLLQQGQALLQQFPWQTPLSTSRLAPLQKFLASWESLFLELENQWSAEAPLLSAQGSWLERLPGQFRQIIQHLMQSQQLPESLHLPLRQLLRQLEPQLREWQRSGQHCERLLQAPAFDGPELQTTTSFAALQEELGPLLEHLRQMPARAGMGSFLPRILHFLEQLRNLPQVPLSLPEAYLELEAQLQPLLQIPAGQSHWASRLPLQLLNLLQQILAPEQLNQVFPQLQRLLPRLALALTQLSPGPGSAEQPQLGRPALQQSLFLPAELTPEQETALARLTEMPQDPETLQRYLQALGLPPQSPAQLQELLKLAGNSRERLDAIAILLRSQMPLLPAHIQIVADYVRLLPPTERFRSISQILLYLSDALLAHMKAELAPHQPQTRLRDLTRPQGWQPDPEAETMGEALLQQLPEEPSETSLESLRYLLQTALPKTAWNLEKLQSLQNMPLQPRQLLQPLQEPLAHLLALLQGLRLQNPTQQQVTMAYLQHLQQFFSQVQQLLSPAQQAQLGPWLMGLTDQLQRLEQQFTAELTQLEQQLDPQTPASSAEGWLSRVIRQVSRIVRQLAQEVPEQREELERLLHRFQQEASHLREELASLHLYTQAEPQAAARSTGTAPPMQMIIPAFIQSLGYPVEILVQESPQEETAAQAGGGTRIQLGIRTHTLGTLLFSLEQRGPRLHIRLGVENARIRDWLQPYLEALSQKLADLPWQVETLQTWIMPEGSATQNLIARQMRTRYRRSAIEAL